MSRLRQAFERKLFLFPRVANIAIAAGWVEGATSIEKFGQNEVVADNVTADVWDGGATGGNLIWDAPTASTHTIASADAGDTAGGAGARAVKVWGLKDWDTKEVSETVIMNTASPNSTVNSYVIIHRMRVTDNGDTSSNIGTITATADTGGVVTAQINPTKGQTHMAIWGLPSVQTAFLGVHCGSLIRASGGGSTGYLAINLAVNHDPANHPTVFVRQSPIGLSLNGTSFYQKFFYVPKVIRGPAIIKMQVASKTSSLDVAAGFMCNVLENYLVKSVG